MHRTLKSLLVALLAIPLGSCASSEGGGASPAARSTKADKSVGRNLATLDSYCWRIDLNKNTDYSVLASANGGGIADATVHAQGAGWGEVLGKAASDLEAAMAAKGITPEAAMAKQGSRTFSAGEIEKLHSRYERIDLQAWYVRATKSGGWTIVCKADVGQVSGVSVFSEGATLIAALDQAVTKLDAEIAKRAANR